MTTVIIPARGGSKGLPGKNLRRLQGETLLARAIRTCKAAGVNDIVVSSDCLAILGEADRCRAHALRRPDSLATDEASTVDVVRHAVQRMGISGTIALVQCTTPFMTANDITHCTNAVETILRRADLAVCVHRFKGVVLGSDGRCINRQLTPAVPRRQDMRWQYQVAGSVWAFDADYLRDNFYSGYVVPVEAEDHRQLDIDTYEDLEQAEKMLAGNQFVMPDIVWEHHHA